MLHLLFSFSAEIICFFYGCILPLFFVSKKIRVWILVFKSKIHTPEKLPEYFSKYPDSLLSFLTFHRSIFHHVLFLNIRISFFFCGTPVLRSLLRLLPLPFHTVRNSLYLLSLQQILRLLRLAVELELPLLSVPE